MDQSLGSYSVYPPDNTQIAPFASATKEFGLSPTDIVLTTTSVLTSITLIVLSKLQPPTLQT